MLLLKLIALKPDFRRCRCSHSRIAEEVTPASSTKVCQKDRLHSAVQRAPGRHASEEPYQGKAY